VDVRVNLNRKRKAAQIFSKSNRISSIQHDRWPRVTDRRHAAMAKPVASRMKSALARPIFSPIS
jgi:hypothetical protein